MVYTEYPNGLNSSKALFMLGFLNANHLNNFEKAKTYYQEFLDKYPEHELADGAKFEVENMGKNPDEIPFLLDEKETDAQNDSNTGDQKSSSTSN
jgi:hypothetical protein